MHLPRYYVVGLASEARSTLSLLPEPSFWLPGDTPAAKGAMEQATDFLRNALDQMIAKVPGADVKYRLVHPERGIRFVHGVGEPVYEEGFVTRFVGTTLDIAEPWSVTSLIG